MAKKKFLDANLFASILFIIVGLLLAFFPESALSWAMTIAGVLFVIFGVLEILRRNWIGGIFSLVVGIAILVLGWTLIDIVVLVLGILIAIKGIITLIQALTRRKKSLLTILFAVLTIIVGIALAFGNGLHIVLVVAGVFLVINGIIGLISAIKN